MTTVAAPRIYSMRKGAESPPADAVYVGRAVPRLGIEVSPWANPFPMRGEWDRARVIAAFREYAEKRLQEEPAWLEPLRGKSLVCWCYPLACHADVLLDLANRPKTVARHITDEMRQALLSRDEDGFYHCPRCDYVVDSPTFLAEHIGIRHDEGRSVS